MQSVNARGDKSDFDRSCLNLLLTPTDAATRNLTAEGVPADRVTQVGDVMYDAALYFGEIASRQSNALAHGDLTEEQFILATIHRQENTDDPQRLEAIFLGLARLAQDIPVVLPLHPRTASRLDAARLTHLTNPINTVAPMGYLDMVAHERAAAAIDTDSGGVQKEAFFYGVPCVTLRDETEWVELVEAGWNRLLSPRHANDVVTTVQDAIGSHGQDVQPYGDGDASSKILTAIRESLDPFDAAVNDPNYKHC